MSCRSRAAPISATSAAIAPPTARTVRRGAVFRSAHLGGLTDTDRAALGKLGVRTIVDLRGVNEAAETPHLIDGLACKVVGAHIEPQLGEQLRGAVDERQRRRRSW